MTPCPRSCPSQKQKTRWPGPAGCSIPEGDRRLIAPSTSPHPDTTAGLRPTGTHVCPGRGTRATGKSRLGCGDVHLLLKANDPGPAMQVGLVSYVPTVRAGMLTKPAAAYDTDRG